MTDTITTTTTGTAMPPTPVIMGPGELVGPVLPEPGWKTSEFWLKVVALVLQPLYASGIVTNNVLESIMLMLITMLGAMGYGIGRSMVKSAASKAGVTVMATQAPPSRSVTRGSLVALVAVVLGAGGVSQVSCGTPAVVTGGAVVVDCLVKDQAQLADLVGSLWAVFASSGSWKDVENSAIAAGKDLGGCALGEVVQKYLAPPAGRAAPAGEKGRAARFALEDYRTQYLGGATLKTSLGNL